MPEIINRTEERVHIDKIKPHPANPNDGDVAAIAKSIRQNGFYGRIVVRDSTGKILAGEHTWRAAKEVGLAEVPIERVECDDETAIRILLTDNATAERAEREPGPLADLLQELEQTEPGLDGTGYVGEDLEELLDDLGRIPGGEEVDDPGAETSRSEELKEEWNTERGQIWRIGEHRLLCGDATDRDDVDRLLDGAEPSLMVTDPPYGVEYDPEWRKEAGVNQNDGKMGRVENDDRVDWSEAFKHAPAEVAYVWHGHNYSGEVTRSVEKVGFERRAMIVWSKDRFALSRGHYHWQHEALIYAVRNGATASWQGGGATNPQCGRSTVRTTKGTVMAPRSQSNATSGQSETTREMCTIRFVAAARASSPLRTRGEAATRWKSILATAPSSFKGAARRDWSAS